jgi:hypothetical protein
MEILELHCHLVSKWNFFYALVQRCETCVSVHRFIKSTHFLARYVLFLVTHIWLKNCSYSWSETLALNDHDQQINIRHQ